MISKRTIIFSFFVVFFNPVKENLTKLFHNTLLLK